MANYCVAADLENRISSLTLAQLTNDTANATTYNSTVVTAILDKVDAEIDAKAGQVYTVPFATIPAIIKQIAIDLACYAVFQRRPVQMDMPKDWEIAHKEALQRLDDISNLLLKLPDTATIASAESSMNDDEVTAVSFNDTDNPMSDF